MFSFCLRVAALPCLLHPCQALLPLVSEVVAVELGEDGAAATVTLPETAQLEFEIVTTPLVGEPAAAAERARVAVGEGRAGSEEAK